MTDEETESHIPPIPSDDAKIWRYLDFTQLTSILERNSLWFNRADMFDDPLEGSYSRANVDTRKQRYQKSEIPEGQVDNIVNTISESARRHKHSTYLNCWHLNERESMAMWELYSVEGQGIAIQSRVGKLKEALRAEDGYINREDTPVPEEISRLKIFTLGAVQYIDYDKHLIPEGNLYAPLFHKRKSFEHEREFRVATSRFDELIRGDGIQEVDEVDLPSGEYISIDVSQLIEKIHVSPSSADWFLQLVEMVAEGSGIDSQIVNRSSLEEDPVF